MNINWNFNNWVPPGKKVKQHLLPSVKAKAKKPWHQEVLNAFIPCNKGVKGGEVVLQKIYRDGRYWTAEEWAAVKTFENGGKFSEKLKAKGFQELGRGYYSQVFYHPKGDKVIKVSRRESPNSYGANAGGFDAWIDYALWGSKYGYAGGFSPKVYSYKNYGNFYVAIMEKMEYTVSSADETNPEAPCAEFLFRQATEMNNQTAKLLCDVLVPGLGDFGEKLKESFGEGRLDLHGGNVMYRKDGSICVTDPVCHRSTLTTKRLRSRDFGPSSFVN